MYCCDIHTHSIASGHGTTDTIADMAREAHAIGLTLLGISDHAPNTMCAGTTSYFRSLCMSPRKRCGVEMLYGIELNILDYYGHVDLDPVTLSTLDYAIASMHRPNIHPGTIAENTAAYIGAMKNPFVSVIGHCDDTHFPCDYEQLVRAAIENHVVLEINNASLDPGGYRGDTRSNAATILRLCMQHNWPVLLSSDSHGREHVGDFRYVVSLLKAVNFPEQLVLNRSAAEVRRFLIR